MIFNLSKVLVSSVSPQEISDLIMRIVRNEHFLKIDAELEEVFLNAVLEHGSSSDKELFELYIPIGMSVTVEIRSYLTTVSDVTYSYNQLLLLADNPSIILMENLREWDVYNSMINAYSSDAVFGNLFKLLQSAAKDMHRLWPSQSGGSGDMLNLLNSVSNRGYSSVLKEKVFVIIDRDTDSPRVLKEGNKKLLERLSGKPFRSLNNEDIYSLSQPNHIWHMWYRREIENYFPDSSFNAIGKTLKSGKQPFEKNHYANVEEYYNYKKNNLKKLAEVTDRSAYEKDLQRFIVYGVEVDEIQLLLLKMIKII